MLLDLRLLVNFSNTSCLFWTRAEIIGSHKQQKLISSIFYFFNTIKIWGKICKLLTTICIRKRIIIKIVDTENVSDGSLPISSILKQCSNIFYFLRIVGGFIVWTLSFNIKDCCPIFLYMLYLSSALIQQSSRAAIYLFPSESRFILLDVIVQHLHNGQEMFTRIPSFPFKRVKAAF